MPRGDRTGPLGQGARTGRGLGVCGFPAGRRANFGGFGRGIGRGIGFGRRFWPQDTQPRISLEDEISFLEERLSELKSIAEAKEE